MQKTKIDRFAITKKLLGNYGFFLRRMFPHINNGLQLNPAAHHKPVLNALNDLVWSKKETKNLMINIAPRSGKTMMCSVYFIPYIAALSKGTCNVILASYSTKIAKKSLNDSVNVINSPLYRDLFKDTVISSFTDGHLRFTNGGNIHPVSPYSSLTGLGAGSVVSSRAIYGLIIIDDILNSADALSATVRSGANDWYSESLLSRCNRVGKTPIVCMSQRLHEEDLPGALMAKEPDKWNTIVIPALDDEGVSFWPDKYNAEYLLSRKDIDPFTFWTQYQQKPVPKGEGIVRERMLHFYGEDEAPIIDSMNTFITADTAMKTGQQHDWSVFQVWQWVGSGETRKIYLLDQVRGKWEAPLLLEKAKVLITSYHPVYMAIEDKSSGTGLIQELRGVYGKDLIRDIKRGTNEGKTQRLHDVSIFMAQGRVLLPDFKPWIHDLTHELLSFTELMTHKHDDQCDALADAIKYGLIDEGASDSLNDKMDHILAYARKDTLEF